jgi:hypothetical protein
MTNVFLEEGLEYIETNAFANNTNLNTVVLPDSVKKVDKTAFPNNVAAIKVTHAPETITDEVTQSLDEAIEFATKHQLSFLEIRSLNDKPFHKLTIEEINEIKEKCEVANLKVAAISSPTYKCDYDNDEVILANIDIFRTCAKYAKILVLPKDKGDYYG